MDAQFDYHTSQTQNHSLALSPAMLQAFSVLQMPVAELEQWLKTQIEENPILEWEEEVAEYDTQKYKQPAHRTHNGETFLAYQPTLFEHLMQQAQHCLETPEELDYAETIIGSLDENGFLSELPDGLDPEKFQKVLSKIQLFDPPGIAALNLRASLSMQLRMKNKEKSLAYQVIEQHFENLLHNRLSLIQKKLQCTLPQLNEAIRKEIAPLDIHPGYRFCHKIVPLALPDLIIQQEEEGWKVEVYGQQLPLFRINPEYLDLQHPYVRNQKAAAQWIRRIVARRNETLRKIGLYLIQKQHAFFEGKSTSLVPLTMREMALHLNIHETTAARAIANKYLDCPQGLLSLRSFFSHPSANLEVSTNSAKEILLKLIREENKSRPLSDQAIVKKMCALGLACSRRTITKYRQHLRINTASQRRKF
jgi:RNA polymerase sigma-54 factor